MEYDSTVIRNKTGSLVEMWLNLESVIQSEVSQKKKNKYCILTNLYIYIWNLGKCCAFEISSPSGCEVASSRGFDLHFLNG